MVNYEMISREILFCLWDSIISRGWMNIATTAKKACVAPLVTYTVTSPHNVPLVLYWQGVVSVLQSSLNWKYLKRGQIHKYWYKGVIHILIFPFPSTYNNELSQKNRIQSVPIAALCLYTYSVKIWFLKILSVSYV